MESQCPLLLYVKGRVFGVGDCRERERERDRVNEREGDRERVRAQWGVIKINTGMQYALDLLFSIS